MMEERYNRLTLIRILDERSRDHHLMGLWLCDCGSEKSIAISRVRNGYAKSCGCLSVELARVRNLTHGKRESAEYSSWQAMKSRCLDQNNKDYSRWGGRGIRIYQEWVDSFAAFYEAVGPRPPGTSLDRKDNRRGYEPGNVRWATAIEQQSNRANNWTVEIHGVVFCSVQAAARTLGVSDATIVRWCDGYVDPRRPHLGKQNSKPGCRRWRTYAA